MDLQLDRWFIYHLDKVKERGGIRWSNPVVVSLQVIVFFWDYDDEAMPNCNLRPLIQGHDIYCRWRNLRDNYSFNGTHCNESSQPSNIVGNIWPKLWSISGTWDLSLVLVNLQHGSSDIYKLALLSVWQTFITSSVTPHTRGLILNVKDCWIRIQQQINLPLTYTMQFSPHIRILKLWLCFLDFAGNRLGVRECCDV